MAITHDAYTGALSTMSSSVINVTTPPGHAIEYIILGVTIAHESVGQLTIKLESPTGTVMTVLERPKGDGDNPPGDNGDDSLSPDDSNLATTHAVYFYDGYPHAAETMGSGLNSDGEVCKDDSRCSYKPGPDQAASPPTFSDAFQGDDPAGDWTLYVADSGPTQTGLLDGWSLTIRHLRPLLPCNEDPFTDVPTTHPFCQEIQWMRDEGISTGFDDDTYRPSAVVTRQAMSAFIARVTGASGMLANCSAPPFSDVPVDHPFCKEIQWMAQADISNGFDDGTYRPSANVTRQAMSAFMARTAGASTTACSTPPFSDVPIDHPFCPEIAWMKESGVSTGFGDGTYRPSINVTRQAMSAFIYRLGVILP